MTNAEKRLLEAEIYKLSSTAQGVLKKFLNELNESTLSLMKVENLPNEIWRNIVGYEGLYQVSNFGRVKSFNFNREKILRPSSSQKGYLQVSLSKNGRKRNWRVNILVAKAFIPNPENKTTVNHKNGNKSDNRVKNLEWKTNGENSRHAVKVGLIKVGAANVLSKLSEQDRKFILENYVPYSKTFGMNSLAKMFGVTKSTIHRIIKRNHKQNL